VVSADGPAFSAEPAVNYPLQSPAAGVEVSRPTAGEHRADYGLGQSSGPDSTTPHGFERFIAGEPPSTAVTNDTTTTTPRTAIVDVTLDAETISYQTYQLTDGSVWMLPIYNYTGLFTNADGSSYTGTWSTIAVDPTTSSIHLVIRRYQSRRPILY